MAPGSADSPIAVHRSESAGSSLDWASSCAILARSWAFVLTLWFFITPICYSGIGIAIECDVPATQESDVFVLVRGYRAIFLDGHAPELLPLVKFWLLALAIFFLGHAWFYKLRKSFADVI